MKQVLWSHPRARGEDVISAQARAGRGRPAGAVPQRGPLAATAPGEPPSSLMWWYVGLNPRWIGAEPRLRCQLLLRTHEWIVDRVLSPGASLPAAIADLHPDGALARELMDLVPPDEAEGWLRFIQRVVATLRHALVQPVTRRDEAWARWLFLLPYAVEITPETRAAAHAAVMR